MKVLSDNISSYKVFVINRSEIESRIDPLYFDTVNDLQIVNNTSFSVKKLSEVVNMKRGRFGHRPRNDPKFYNGDYPFIQTGDVVRASLSGGQIEYSQTLNELGLKTSRLFEPKVIVLTIAANIGDTAILDYPACFPDSLIAVTPKDENVLDLEYLNIYFKFIKEYLNNLAPQAAQKNINYQQLAPTPVVVPPKSTQESIVRIFNNAFSQKQQKESKATELLNGIDTYLLKELGIKLPKKNNALDNRIFTAQFSEITGGRFDGYYNSTYFREAEINLLQSNSNIVSLKEVITFIESGSRPTGGVSNIESGILSFGGEHVNDSCEIELKNPKYIPEDFHNKILKTQTELHDVILVKDGATTGKIGIIEKDEHVGQNINEHVFMIKSNEKINPFYLAYYLHSESAQIQISRGITGATVTGLTKDVVKNLHIPLPDLDKQNEIVVHIQAIRQQAKQLQEDARMGLEEAKKEVEQMILGEK